MRAVGAPKPTTRDPLHGEGLRHGRYAEPGIPQLQHPPAFRLRQLRGPGRGGIPAAVRPGRASETTDPDTPRSENLAAA